MIVFGGGAIDCIVHNVSKTGAAFDVTSPVGIPEQFTLVIPGDGLNVGCRIIWRLGLSIGVKFDIGARGIAGGHATPSQTAKSTTVPSAAPVGFRLSAG
jgi:PilZ domain